MSLGTFPPLLISFLESFMRPVVEGKRFVYVVILMFGFSLLEGCVATCGGRITKSSGIIRSPQYPNSNLRPFTCKWDIIAKDYETILLSFTVFNVLMGRPSINQSTPLCDRDYVEILDGKNSLGKYCNNWENYPKGSIRSKSSSVTIIFKTVASHFGGKSTFQANYQTRCGQTLTSLTGEITSPNYPKPYPVPLYCSWAVQVPKDKVIRFFFLEFNLETTSKCNKDYVKAMDGLNITSRLIGHFCADRTPPKELRSTGNTMMVAFRSLTPTSTGGFHLYYETEPHCGGFLRGSTGSFTSPDYGSAVHTTSPHDCQWTIEVEAGMVISVVFASFDVKSSMRCISDYVEIIDGSGHDARKMGRYCGREVVNPPTVHSTKNTMVIILHRSTDSGKGFFATYTAVDPTNPYDNCAEASDELLYKCNNGNYIQCRWKCDGTDDCGDNSDEKNCVISTGKSKKSTKITSYVIILVSITGSAVLIALLIFIIDRLRRKRRSQANSRRRRRRRARLRGLHLNAESREPSSPPPTYDFAVAVSNCCDTSSLPPPYSETTTASDNSDVTSATNQTAIDSVEQSGNNVEEMATSSVETGTSVDEPTTSNLDINVECVSMGESPPTSETSPLII